MAPNELVGCEHNGLFWPRIIIPNTTVVASLLHFILIIIINIIINLFIYTYDYSMSIS